MRKISYIIILSFLVAILAYSVSADITSNLDMRIKGDGDYNDANGVYNCTPGGGGVTLNTSCGKIGSGCIMFNGANMLTCASVPLSLPGRTYAFWYKTGQNYGGLLSRENAPYAKPWKDVYNSDGNHQGIAGTGVANTIIYDSTTGSPTGNQYLAVNGWTHYAVVFKSLTNTTIYVNGAVNKTSSTSIVSTDDTSITLKIGFAANVYFTGMIDDIRVYSRALEASEITELYQFTGSTPTPPSIAFTQIYNTTRINGFNISWSTVGNYSSSLVYVSGSLAYNGTTKAYNSSVLSNNTAYPISIKILYNETVWNETNFTLMTSQSVPQLNYFVYTDNFSDCTNWSKRSGGGTLDCSGGTFKCSGGNCLSDGIIYGNFHVNVNKDFVWLNMTWKWDPSGGNVPGAGLFTSTSWYDTPQPWLTFNPDTGTANNNIWIYQVDGVSDLLYHAYPGNARPTSGLHNVTMYWLKVGSSYNISVKLDNETYYPYGLATLADQDGLFPAMSAFRSDTGYYDDLRMEWATISNQTGAGPYQPTNASIYSPQASTYDASVLINTSSCVSVDTLNRYRYEYDSGSGYIDIVSNNYPSTTYTWNTSAMAAGTYRIRFTCYTVNNLSASAVSPDFTIAHATTGGSGTTTIDGTSIREGFIIFSCVILFIFTVLLFMWNTILTMSGQTRSFIVGIIVCVLFLFLRNMFVSVDIPIDMVCYMGAALSFLSLFNLAPKA